MFESYNSPLACVEKCCVYRSSHGRSLVFCIPFLWKSISQSYAKYDHHVAWNFDQNNCTNFYLGCVNWSSPKPILMGISCIGWLYFNDSGNSLFLTVKLFYSFPFLFLLNCFSPSLFFQQSHQHGATRILWVLANVASLCYNLFP